jgi:hypothetical protein
MVAIAILSDDRGAAVAVRLALRRLIEKPILTDFGDVVLAFDLTLLGAVQRQADLFALYAGVAVLAVGFNFIFLLDEGAVVGAAILLLARFLQVSTLENFRLIVAAVDLTLFGELAGAILADPGFLPDAAPLGLKADIEQTDLADIRGVLLTENLILIRIICIAGLLDSRGVFDATVLILLGSVTIAALLDRRNVLDTVKLTLPGIIAIAKLADVHSIACAERLALIRIIAITALMDRDAAFEADRLTLLRLVMGAQLFDRRDIFARNDKRDVIGTHLLIRHDALDTQRIATEGNRRNQKSSGNHTNRAFHKNPLFVETLMLLNVC